MTIYSVIYAETTDVSMFCSDATFANARDGTGTLTAGGNTSSSVSCSTYLDAGVYWCGQGFMEFNASTLSGSVASCTFNFKTSAAVSGGGGTAASDTVEIYAFEWPSPPTTADFQSGIAIAGMAIAASGTKPATSGTAFTCTGGGSGMTAGGMLKVLLTSQRQRTNTAPTSGARAVLSADNSGTVDDPSLLLITTQHWGFVGSSSAAAVTTNNITLSEPSGAAQGDLLVACIAYRAATTDAWSMPSSEWTKVEEQVTVSTATTSSGVGSIMMAYCVRGASAPSYAFTRAGGGNVAMGAVMCYRGNTSGTAIDVSAKSVAGASSTAISLTGVTTSQDDDLIVVALGGGDNVTMSQVLASSASPTALSTSGTGSGVMAAPAANAFQERFDANTTSGADTTLAVYDAVKTGAGATGTVGATASGAALHAGIVAAFKIAPGVVTVYSLIFSPTPLQFMLVR